MSVPVDLGIPTLERQTSVKTVLLAIVATDTGAKQKPETEGASATPTEQPKSGTGPVASSASAKPVVKRPPGLRGISDRLKPQIAKELEQHKEARDQLLAEPPANAGSAWLLEQRKKRPNGINDALSATGPQAKHGLEINCSLCTIGAMTNKTSSQISESLGVKTGGQSMTVWADPSDNFDNEDAAYDFGGQLGGMSNALLKFAAESDGEAEFVNNAELVDSTRTKYVPKPGSEEEFDEVQVPCKVAKPMAEDELLAKMKEMPDGTRFAVMVFGSTDVETHWVNAEKFNGKLVFEDFQQNIKQPLPKKKDQPGGEFVDEERPTVESLPRGPKTGEAIFKRGMFLALKPTPKVLGV